MTDPRVTRLAHLLVDYSVDVQPNDRVVITALPGSAPLIEAVYERILERGGLPHLLLSLPHLDEIFFRTANDAQLAYIPPFAKLAAETFEGRINIAGGANARALSGIDPARQSLQRKALTPLMETFMRRDADHSLKWMTTLFPTELQAQDADMSLRDYEDFVYRACHVDSDDDPVAYWKKVAAEQKRLADWLKPHNKVVVRGPNADLSLSIKGRTFVSADGRNNMPDGEIFTGPVEASVNGWVRFTYPAVYGGREVLGAEVYFEEGQVVKATASKNEDFMRATLHTDPGASYLGEFAFGTNFGIQRFTRSILFDEKIGGSMHMAFGAGYPITGSQNKSGLHWDMICDMRDGSEVRVDGELFYQNGEFKV